MSYDTAKSDQDKFRCFILDLTNSNQSIALSQSNDASCEGLTSPTDGIRSLKLTRLDASNRASFSFFSSQFNSEPCTFPAELVGKRLLSTLDGTSIYEFSNNFTLNIRNSRNKQQLINSYTCLTQRSNEQHFATHHQNNLANQYNGRMASSSTLQHHPKSLAWSVRTHSSHQQLQNGHPNGKVQTRTSFGHLIGSSSSNVSNTYPEYIIHSTKECSIGYACLRIYKRTSNIYEFWIGSTEKNPFDVCTYSSHLSIPTTLATLQLEPQKCPFEGVFALSNLAKGSLIRSNGLSIGLCAQSQLRVNCNEDTHKLELQARCSFQDESLGFVCNGGWKDEKNHYLLLTSEDGANKYCLTYQGANHPSKHEHNKQFLNQDHLFVSLNSISCHRSVHHSSKFAYFGQSLATNHYRHSHESINFELIKQGSCYSSMEISGSTWIRNDLKEKLLKFIFTVIFTWFIIIR